MIIRFLKFLSVFFLAVIIHFVIRFIMEEKLGVPKDYAIAVSSGASATILVSWFYGRI